VVSILVHEPTRKTASSGSPPFPGEVLQGDDPFPVHQHVRYGRDLLVLKLKGHKLSEFFY
jgi:hypothetical protein